MRLLAWNINHRGKMKRIPPELTKALAALTPDVVVLTEYVPGPSRAEFLRDLDSIGLKYRCESSYSPGQNHVLIASRQLLEEGSIRARGIHESVPSNALHVRLPGGGIEILGLRLPDLGRQPPLRREWWDWILTTACAVRDRPFAILGDFNTDPCYPRAKCGDRIATLVALGWQHAIPPQGASYRTPTGLERRIDHCFVSGHFTVQCSSYIWEVGPHLLAGKAASALSDHAAPRRGLVDGRRSRPGWKG
ncbi:MAG: endonuclease/exonuclease/phosphatase family protein [Acidobacteria bacterium]|nr:endonuclease/exonuclease/phosphatase family protein [Acidobacteriota bacterium]